MLTGAELSRYARQLVLPEVGLAGQEALRTARVLVVGAGGLGSPAALYLGAAGVGHLGLLDDDRVELSNLHRQILHGTAGVGQLKTTSGAGTLHRLNEHVQVREHTVRLDQANAPEIIRAYDVVVDGSDNYATRYAVNDACAALGVPWVYGSVERFAAQISVFGVADGPCYRCLFPAPPDAGSTPNCEEIGVLGAVPGIVGAMQALEALKLVLGAGRPLAGRLWQLDLLGGAMHSVELARRADCEVCSRARTASAARGVETQRDATDHTTRAAFAQEHPDASDITPAELAARMGSADSLTLLDVREHWEVRIAGLPSARHVLLNHLPDAIGTLDRAHELVVFCHHGVRSAMAAQWLRENGFRARNLEGGIDRWSREVDPRVPRY